MQVINGLFGMMDIGKGGLFASQKGIDVAGHNIANVNTPGYSRQRAVMATGLPLSATPGQVGTGVTVQEVIRIHDQYIETELRSETSGLGRWEAEKGVLERLEMLVEGYGLDSVMGEFWNAWEDLSNNPAGQAERVVLLSRSEQLAQGIQGLYDDVTTLEEEEMGEMISGTVSEINLLTSEIADLNQTILGTEGNGQNANDSRDRRDALLRDLASLVDINVVEGNDGMVNVFLGGGRALVQSNEAMTLGTETNPVTHLTDVIYLGKGDDHIDITAEIEGGKLKGLRPDSIFGEFLDRLNALAETLITRVNALHSQGYGLDGTTGRAFFSGSSAADIAVHQDILDDVNRIAAAGPTDGLPGGNSNALAIAGLRNALTMNGGTATFDMEYNSLVSRVGSWAQTAEFYNDQETALVNQAETLRESVSGVQMDEEMVNLLEFQHSYAAAAQYVRMIDKLLEDVIKLV